MARGSGASFARAAGSKISARLFFQQQLQPNQTSEMDSACKNAPGTALPHKNIIVSIPPGLDSRIFGQNSQINYAFLRARRSITYALLAKSIRASSLS